MDGNKTTLALTLTVPALPSLPEGGMSVIFDSHACDGQNDNVFKPPVVGTGKEGQRGRGCMNEKQGQSGE